MQCSAVTTKSNTCHYSMHSYMSKGIIHVSLQHQPHHTMSVTEPSSLSSTFYCRQEMALPSISTLSTSYATLNQTPKAMYYSPASTSHFLLRTSSSGIRFASSSFSRTSRLFSFSVSKPSSVLSTQSSVSFFNQKLQSLSFSSALWSLPRWNHHADWRSSSFTISGRARITAPVTQKFDRKIATMGMTI